MRCRINMIRKFENRKDDIVKARKEHICTLCEKKIKKDERHYSSKFARGKRHLNCVDEGKYNIDLNSDVCVSCGDVSDVCPKCNNNGHKEHIENFGKCGKCVLKERKI